MKSSKKVNAQRLSDLSIQEGFRLVTASDTTYHHTVKELKERSKAEYEMKLHVYRGIETSYTL